MPTVNQFVSVSEWKKIKKDIHSFFVCMLYFKEFQESIVNLKNSSVTTAHCSPKEQWVKFKVPAIESHSELFL